ncbi:MAG: polysaccharide biosynthesis C-terminal domain-containing protein [Firmicutes bacterium]|nr:polysaccharide biosynthesis C-terminal domain-containing protein [Bacillota bacterium]
MAANKYKKLLSNTITFGIGTFSAKLLTFLLVPLYTRILTTAEFNASDLIQQTGNLLVPLVSVGMASALIRFGLDKSYDKVSVFSTALMTAGCGFAVFLLISPLILLVPDISEHLVLLILFVIMSALRSLCSQFVRSLGYVKLFSYDGVQSTVLTIVFNVLFLVVFRMGVTGYILATVVSDFLSALFLFLMADLHRYVRFSKTDREVFRAMVRFSVPMIPTALFWWIINVSDRYAVTWMVGRAEAGIYAAAYKVPTIVSLVSSVFTEAWQMSAVMEKDSANRDQFFTKVFSALSSLLFLTSSALIVCSKLITKILVGPSFYESWRYIPILVVATSFSCFANFLNSVYMVERKSVLSLLTVMSGAVSNVVLNILLIPPMGVNGAALATFISYVLVFVMRAVTSRKYIRIGFHPVRMGLNLAVSGVQCYMMIAEVHLWQLWVPLMFAVLCVLNLRPLLLAAKTMLRRRTAAG